MHRRTTRAAAWTLLIFALCWWPKPRMGASEARATLFVPNVDKAVHFALFAGYGWLWTAATTRSRAWVVGATGLAAAVLSEVGQSLPIIDRDSSVFDALADAAGLAAGILAARRGAP